MDYILNGSAQGNVASTMMQHNFRVESLRPYIGKDGRTYVTRIDNSGKLVATPVNNAVATLRKDDWKILDDAIIKAAKPRLRAVADLRSRGLTYSIPNGMGKTVLETERQSDINDASVSMNGLRDNANDTPKFELTNLPLPIIHKDFHYSARQIQASRNGGSPLDTTMAELASRKVSEEAEKLLIGNSANYDQYSFGGGVIYGYTDHPDRLTKTITSPTASGWLGTTLVTEVLAMMGQSRAAYHYGPWVLYNSPNWDKYLDDDYKSNSDKTLRQRLKEIQDIEDVKTLDYMTGYDMILVQMTSDVAREVIGMDLVTVQWETNGGLMVHFKVMAIMVPQIRSDFNDNTGIVHATV